MFGSQGHQHHRFVCASTTETLRWLTLAGSLAIAATVLLYWVDRLVTLAP